MTEGIYNLSSRICNSVIEELITYLYLNYDEIIFEIYNDDYTIEILYGSINLINGEKIIFLYNKVSRLNRTKATTLIKSDYKYNIIIYNIGIELNYNIINSLMKDEIIKDLIKLNESCINSLLTFDENKKKLVEEIVIKYLPSFIKTINCIRYFDDNIFRTGLLNFINQPELFYNINTQNFKSYDIGDIIVTTILYGFLSQNIRFFNFHKYIYLYIYEIGFPSLDDNSYLKKLYINKNYESIINHIYRWSNKYTQNPIHINDDHNNFRVIGDLYYNSCFDNITPWYTSDNMYDFGGYKKFNFINYEYYDFLQYTRDITYYIAYDNSYYNDYDSSLWEYYFVIDY